MNIQDAKKYIKDTIRAYLKKDEFGDYRISVEKQRPIFLIGAPGIGKTAIMSQIANELQIALVSYSMTHHTRQSALGLPFIKEKNYKGDVYSVSEYTMSEIIASVYDVMEESGVKEGILFLDEINCVSETLYPSMLQFLQYKVFGKHRVPEGWIIVTAGNPPEFNKAVREFDVVTLDRLKVIDVDADYPAWKKYALEKGIHGSILGFLESNKDCFYVIETTAGGKSYVTARGWEDLSDMIFLYEEDNGRVSEELIFQYLRNERVTKEFAAYYDLYNKYKRKVDIEAVFEKSLSEKVRETLPLAPIDEKLALIGLLCDTLREELKAVMDEYEILSDLKGVVAAIAGSGEDCMKALEEAIQKLDGEMRARLRAGSLLHAGKTRYKKKISLLRKFDELSSDENDIKSLYNAEIAAFRGKVKNAQVRSDNLLDEISAIFGSESNEMLLLISELTLDNYCASFFASFGLEGYEKYSEILKVADRSDALRKEIEELM